MPFSNNPNKEAAIAEVGMKTMTRMAAVVVGTIVFILAMWGLGWLDLRTFALAVGISVVSLVIDIIRWTVEMSRIERDYR